MKPSPRSRRRGTWIWAVLTLAGIALLLAFPRTYQPWCWIRLIAYPTKDGWTATDDRVAGMEPWPPDGACLVEVFTESRVDPLFLPLVRSVRVTSVQVWPVVQGDPHDEASAHAVSTEFLTTHPGWTRIPLNGSTARQWPWVYTLLALVIWVQWFGVRWLIIRLIEDGVRTAPPPPAGQCRACGYMTAGLRGPVCPECGRDDRRSGA